jgi:hypothetical protein
LVSKRCRVIVDDFVIPFYSETPYYHNKDIFELPFNQLFNYLHFQTEFNLKEGPKKNPVLHTSNLHCGTYIYRNWRNIQKTKIHLFCSYTEKKIGQHQLNINWRSKILSGPAKYFLLQLNFDGYFPIQINIFQKG